MPNPFAPLLGFFGAASAAGSGGSTKKRRRKKKTKSKANGTSTQRKSSRALDIIRIQRGLPRDQDPLPQTDGEVAETDVPRAPVAGVRPPNAPNLRIAKAIGNDTIGMTTDGQRGYVGAQWWTRSGRSLLAQIRRRHPSATPDEALALLLKQAVPSVDWEAGELPRGARMLERRLRRLLEASYMGREVEVSRPVVHPKEAVPPNTDDGEGTEGASGLPFAPDIEGDDSPRRPVPDGIEIQPQSAVEPSQEPETASAGTPEAGEAGTAQEGAQSPQPARTRRGGRGGRGGKKERKAAAAAVAAAEATAAEDAAPAAVAAAEATAAEDAAPAAEATAAEDAAPEETAHDTPEGDGDGASGDSSAQGDVTDPEANKPSGE